MTRMALWPTWAPACGRSRFRKGSVQTGSGRRLTDCACARAVCRAAAGCVNPRWLLTPTPALTPAQEMQLWGVLASALPAPGLA